MCYGTAGYFEWNNEPHQVLELFEEFPELMTGELKMGLIHTHHKLGIYFSHTDNEELMESTPLYKGGIYLSLIVGYSPNYTARACVNMKYTTAFDVQDAKSTVTGNAIGYYHCKVVSKRQEIFEKKLKEIYKDYKESQKPRNFPYKQTFTPANHDTDQLNMFAEDWFGQEELEETWNIYAPEDFALRAIPTNAQKRSRKSKK